MWLTLEPLFSFFLFFLFGFSDLLSDWSLSVSAQKSCKLGQHRPISKVHADGIVRVGGAAAKKSSEQPVSDWFLKAASGSSDAFAKLKLFAQVCRHDLGKTHLSLLVIPAVTGIYQRLLVSLIFILFLVSSAPYLATQSLDSSLLIQPTPVTSSTQSSSSQSSCSASSNSQISMASGGSALNNNSAASNSGSGLPGNTNNTPSSSSGPQGSSIQSAKPSSFPPFGSMGVQGNSSQSGALGQQAVTQNSSLSGDNSTVNSQTQGPSEPPERCTMYLLPFPVLIVASCINLSPVKM